MPTDRLELYRGRFIRFSVNSWNWKTGSSSFGPKVRGGYSAWFGFSSLRGNDLYCGQRNNRVLSSPFPSAQIAA